MKLLIVVTFTTLGNSGLLIDTSVLVSAAQKRHSQNRVALAALESLRMRESRLYVPQNIYEFWVVCTRPERANGLGFTAQSASQELSKLKRLFIVLPDPPQLYSEWERLVTHYEVIGKQAHDARLAAAIRLYRLNYILTFDRAHFARFAEVTTIQPEDVSGGSFRPM